MAWTAPTDRTTGDIITAAQWNTFLGATGDMSMTAAAKVTTNGDIVYATAANTLARLGIGSTAQVLTVSGGIPAWATPSAGTFFDLLQTAFRVPRRMLAMFSAVFVPAMFDGVTYSPATIGVGFTHTNSANSTTSTGTLNNALLESYTTQNTGGTATDVYASTTGGSSFTMSPSTAPNKNPRMSVRYFPGASSVQMRSFVGFMASAANASETASGAYLRVNTTGNLFFVTRQGASETTTDLGARPTTLTSYEIETTDSGVTWTCRNVTTAAVVATHTANVPTAASGLGYVIGGRSASGDLVVNNVNYCEVESNSVA